MSEEHETASKLRWCPGCHQVCVEGFLIVVVRRGTRQRRLAHDEDCIELATETLYVEKNLGHYKLVGANLMRVKDGDEQRIAEPDPAKG